MWDVLHATILEKLVTVMVSFNASPEMMMHHLTQIQDNASVTMDFSTMTLATRLTVKNETMPDSHEQKNLVMTAQSAIPVSMPSHPIPLNAEILARMITMLTVAYAVHAITLVKHALGQTMMIVILEMIPTLR